MEYGDFVPDSDVEEGTESDELTRPALVQRSGVALSAQQSSHEAHDPVALEPTHTAPPQQEPPLSHTNSSDEAQQLQCVDGRSTQERSDTSGAEPPCLLPHDIHKAGSHDVEPRAHASGHDASVSRPYNSNSNVMPNAPESRVRVFQVGDLVEVESRTWPGINKPGGSGRVAGVHRETTSAGDVHVFYDVRYVLGGFEKRIESAYVELSHILELARAQGRVRYERVFYHGTSYRTVSRSL